MPEVTAKAAALDGPPPGAGFVTTTAKLPAVLRSVAPSVTVNWPLLIYEATCETPLNVTVEEGRKPIPLIVTKKDCVPTLTELGAREEMVGVGFGVTTACTTKLCEPDRPAVSGFFTVTA
jgi:hypothetical protein